MAFSTKNFALFSETPVSKLTWYSLLIPIYLAVSGGISLFSAVPSPFLFFISLNLGCFIALRMYLQLGLISTATTSLKAWGPAMQSMWMRGTVLMIMVALPIPVWLRWLEIQPENAQQFFSHFLLPLVLGFLLVSSMAVLTYAVSYRMLAKFIEIYGQNRKSI